jgi:hypothetical protein
VLGTPNNGRLSVPQASRRDTPVKCAMCGRSVTRRSRQQRYCSDRCRDFVRCENNGRTANGFNGLQAAKSGSSPRIYGPRRVIERELVAGRDWAPVVSPDGVICVVASRRRP